MHRNQIEGFKLFGTSVKLEDVPPSGNDGGCEVRLPPKLAHSNVNWAHLTAGRCPNCGSPLAFVVAEDEGRTYGELLEVIDKFKTRPAGFPTLDRFRKCSFDEVLDLASRRAREKGWKENIPVSIAGLGPAMKGGVKAFPILWRRNGEVIIEYTSYSPLAVVPMARLHLVLFDAKGMN